MKTVYAIVGDFYHNHDVMFNALSLCAQRLGGIQLKREFIDHIEAVIKQKPDAIIIARENRINPEEETEPREWLTNALDDLLEAYVSDGGNLFALHTGIASYDTNSKYIQMLRGHFVSHPPEHCPVTYYSDDYDFTIAEDEKYFVEVDENNTQVFLRAKSEHGEQLAGWKHTYGRGRVICLCPTHTKDGFKHEQIKKLLDESLNWALNG